MTLLESLDAGELAALEARWGAFPVNHHALTVAHPFLSGDHQQLVSDRRRAEICYVMHRGDPAAGVLLHIKTFYPEGAFRLPTGGIHQGESVEDTLAREIYEETGLTVRQWRCESTGHAAETDRGAGFDMGPDGVCVERLLGVTGYLFEHPHLGERSFATYYFLTRMSADGRLTPTDPEENIGGWAWTPAAHLPATAERLATVGTVAPDWGDWGRYRAFGHEFVAAALT